MNKRIFLRACVASVCIFASLNAFALMKNPLSGMQAVNATKGNSASQVDVVDSFAPMPARAEALAEYKANASNFGVNAALFVPPASLFDGALSLAKASEYNTNAAKIIGEENKYKFAAALPLGDDETLVLEIQKLAKNKSVSAIVLPCKNEKGEKISEVKFAKIFQEIAKAKLSLILYANSKLSNLERDSELGIAAMELAESKILPSDLNVVLPDLGGTFAWNLLLQNKSLKGKENFYFFVSSRIGDAALSCIETYAGKEKFVFGSKGATDFKALIKELGKIDFSSGSYDAACYENAEKLFNIKL